MLVGVQTIRQGSDACEGNENRFLKRFLESAGKLQAETRFVVFTHEYNHDYFADWQRIRIDQQGAVARWMGKHSGLENAVKKSLVDLVFAPVQDALLSLKLPQVLYGMDLAPWESVAPGAATTQHSAQLKHIKKVCAQSAAMVVASDYLRRRCLEVFEAPLDKTIVAKAGVSPAFFSEQATIVEKPYILVAFDRYTADRMPRLCEIFRKRRNEFPHALVVVGPAGPPEREQWDDHVVRIEQCPDRLLSGLYQNSDLFIYPALHDGNALRPLEAMASRAPMVIANTGAIAELAGSAPFYFNAASAASLLQAVRRALGEAEESRQERLELGRRTAMAYTWEKTAWKVLSAFKRG